MKKYLLLSTYVLFFAITVASANETLREGLAAVPNCSKEGSAHVIKVVKDRKSLIVYVRFDHDGHTEKSTMEMPLNNRTPKVGAGFCNDESAQGEND